MTQLPQKFTLPGAMAQKLELVRRRTLKVRVGTAIIAAIAVLLSAMGIAMLVDWLSTLFDFRWRAVLTYSAWAMAITTLVSWGLAAWRHTRRVDGVAAKVDQQIPELEERWSTVTQISAGQISAGQISDSGAAKQNGSATTVHPAMFEQVSKEAQSWTPRIEPDRVIPLDGLIRALLFLTAVTTVLGIAVLIDSQRTTVLMRRFWQPFTPISATQITDLSGNLVVGRGESLEIQANLIGASVNQASLMLKPQQGEPTSITLTPRGEDKDELNHRLRTVKKPMQYRLRAGDGQTPWYDIVVADRPQLANVRVTLTPPSYTRKEPKTINKLPRRVTVLEGSHALVEFKPKQSLRSLALRFSPKQIKQLTAEQDGWYRWETTLTKNIAFQTLLTEEHGLDNLRPPKCELRIRPDRPPVVKIITPNSQMAVRPDDTVPVTFVARDDVGVQQAELVVYDESNKTDGKPTVLDRIAVPLGDQQGQVKVKATVKLDLSKYETSDGAELSFSVRVREDRGQIAMENQQPKSENSNANAASLANAQETSTSNAEQGEMNPSSGEGQPPQNKNVAESVATSPQPVDSQNSSQQPLTSAPLTSINDDSSSNLTANNQSANQSAVKNSSATNSQTNNPQANNTGSNNTASTPSNNGQNNSMNSTTAQQNGQQNNSAQSSAAGPQNNSGNSNANQQSNNANSSTGNNTNNNTATNNSEPNSTPAEDQAGAEPSGRTTASGRQSLNSGANGAD